MSLFISYRQHVVTARPEARSLVVRSPDEARTRLEDLNHAFGIGVHYDIEPYTCERALSELASFLFLVSNNILPYLSVASLIAHGKVPRCACHANHRFENEAKNGPGMCRNRCHAMNRCVREYANRPRRATTRSWTDTLVFADS